MKREQKKAEKKGRRRAKLQAKRRKLKAQGKKVKDGKLTMLIFEKVATTTAHGLVKLIVENLAKLLDWIVAELGEANAQEGVEATVSATLIDTRLLARFANAASGILKMSRFHGKGPGRRSTRRARSVAFKHFFGGRVAFAVDDILLDSQKKVVRRASSAAASGLHRASSAAASGLVQAAVVKVVPTVANVDVDTAAVAIITAVEAVETAVENLATISTASSPVTGDAVATRPLVGGGGPVPADDAGEERVSTLGERSTSYSTAVRASVTPLSRHVDADASACAAPSAAIANSAQTTEGSDTVGSVQDESVNAIIEAVIMEIKCHVCAKKRAMMIEGVSRGSLFCPYRVSCTNLS